MPTFKEQQELLDKCRWSWTEINSVNGYKVTGPNGNSIFLPTAGDRYGTEVDNSGTIGGYWSASLNDDYRDCAYFLHLGIFHHDCNSNLRFIGYSVRPVSE